MSMGLPGTSFHAQYLAKPLANMDINYVAFAELGGALSLGQTHRAVPPHPCLCGDMCPQRPWQQTDNLLPRGQSSDRLPLGTQRSCESSAIPGARSGSFTSHPDRKEAETGLWEWEATRARRHRLITWRQPGHRPPKHRHRLENKSYFPQ